MFDGFTTQRIKTSEVELQVRAGGTGPALLLLHGYPQNHLMWHKIAPRLTQEFTVVAPDLRGYGASDKPAGGDDHATYSKRAMARDQVELMRALGHPRFMLAGHDRGARVAHRLALDHPDAVTRIAVLDIVPTHYVFTHVDQQLATGYFHWFFLIQKHDFPERLIGADPEFYLKSLLGRWGSDATVFPAPVLDEYVRCLRDPAMIHATCEDYRAAASIDLEHDAADLHIKLRQPLLALWGARGFVGNHYDPVSVWRERAADVRGHALDCGHFLPEEKPEETYQALHAFFSA
jgi:haloacetate dehalogenase